MDKVSAKKNSKSIVLTTGIYDLLKDQLRLRKLSKFNEEKLALELKSATQVLRKDLPDDIVTVDKTVVVKQIDTGDEFKYNLVGPTRAKRKNNTLSILSPIGIAILGYSQGDELSWEMPDGILEYRIEKVAPLNSI